MPTVSLSELKKNAASQIAEQDAYWASRGMLRQGNKYVPDPNFLNPQQQAGTANTLQGLQYEIEDRPIKQEQQQINLEKSRIELDKAKRTAAQPNDLERSGAFVNQTIQELQNLSTRVNTSNNRLMQIKRLVGVATQKDVDATQLQSMRAYLAPIIRQLGEKGTLSDSDVKRAIGAIPGVTDTQAVAGRKLATLQRVLGAALGTNTPTNTQSSQPSGSRFKIEVVQ